MMIRCISVLGVVLSWSAPALGCDYPSDAGDMQFHGQAFVGTVVGYRMDDTSLITDVPYCPHGGEVSNGASDFCAGFWDKLVAVQFEVETPIKGILGNRKFEIVSRNDAGCAPLPGERWLTSGWYRDGFSVKLESAPNQEEVERWRSIAHEER